MKKTFMLACMLTCTTMLATAQSTNTPKFDKRQENQQKRIDEGVKNGSITSKEQARLEKEQEHLQKKEDRIKADGKVTKRERSVLQHVEDKTSKDIYRKKHNGHHN